MPIDKRFFTVNQMLAGDLADAIDATVIGDRDVDILDVAPFSESKSGDLTFYTGGTQEDGLSFVDRSVVITTHEVAGGLPSEVVALVVDNPRLGFAVASLLALPRTARVYLLNEWGEEIGHYRGVEDRDARAGESNATSAVMAASVSTETASELILISPSIQTVLV